MLTYCLNFKRDTKKCAVCGCKKSRFMKEQEAERLLSNLGIKTTLSEIPLLNILF